MKTTMANEHVSAFGVFAMFAGCLVTCAPVMATVTYTYENDNKTLVATVTDADTALTTSAADQAWFKNYAITNFVKRGGYSLNVWESVANSFSGDIRIEGNQLLFYANALGINRAQGKIQIHKGDLVHGGNNKVVTIAKDIEFGYGGGWNARSFQVWENRVAFVTGKITIGDRNARIMAYKNGSLTISGGIEDPPAGDKGYLYLGVYGGATMTITETPINITNPLYFIWTADSTKYDEQGFLGYYAFGAPGNNMKALGWTADGTRYGIGNIKVSTTADWAFNSSNMKVYFDNAGVFDLYGTSQRVGQLDVEASAGKASVVTNSIAEPATFHMGRMYAPQNGIPNIRFGGNLSVVFENNIFNTVVNHEMTAVGGLVMDAAGTLSFTENGSWANATNVTVSGSGKITVANPNAFGRKARVNLKSSSSLEIASGVTVHVKTLTVDGVLQQAGDYTFGDGTLSVSHPCGLMLSFR